MNRMQRSLFIQICEPTFTYFTLRLMANPYKCNIVQTFVKIYPISLGYIYTVATGIDVKLSLCTLFPIMRFFTSR